MSELRWVMMMGLSGLCACGNANNVEVAATGIETGNVQIISLVNHQVVSQKTLEGSRAQFGIAELGLEPFEVKISNDKNEFVSAIIASDRVQNEIQVNALTTLASCRLKKVGMNAELNKQIETQNHLLAEQFHMRDLQTSPDRDFKNIQSLNDHTLYGILLGGFEELAAQQKQSILGLTTLLCDDVMFDGVFNAVSSDGLIQQKHPFFDEQVLKSRYAQGIFDFAQKKVPLAAKLPIQAIANEISITAIEGLFSPTIVNYSFDH